MEGRITDSIGVGWVYLKDNNISIIYVGSLVKYDVMF